MTMREIAGNNTFSASPFASREEGECWLACPSRMQLMKITKKQFVDDVVSIGRHFKGVQNDMKYLALQVVS
jgi:peroxiredoxin family protein